MELVDAVAARPSCDSPMPARAHQRGPVAATPAPLLARPQSSSVVRSQGMGHAAADDRVRRGRGNCTVRRHDGGRGAVGKGARRGEQMSGLEMLIHAAVGG